MIKPESRKALIALREALREALAMLLFYCESTPIVKKFLVSSEVNLQD